MQPTRDGIIIQDRHAEGRTSAKRYRARVWDPRKRKYRSKAYEIERDAEAWAKGEKAKMSLGMSSAGRLTLASLSEEYADDLTRRGRTEKHVDEVRAILTEAAGAGVYDLKSDGLRAAVRRWLKPTDRLSPRSRNKRLAILHGAIIYALGESMLTTDPMQGIRMETEAAAGRLRSVFAPKDLAVIVSDDHRARIYWREACAMAYLGLRVGEAAALRWEWFDFAGRVVNIRQDPDNTFSPKRHRERSVPLMAEALDLFRSLAPRSRAGRFPLRPSTSPVQASRTCMDYLKAVGMQPGRGAHCIRHSWVSLRLALGVSSLVVRDQAGHETVKTTEKYSHAIAPGWIDGWPREVAGEFWLRRELP